MTSQEFWKLTPYQFFSLVEYSNIKILKEDYRHGVLIELIFNMFSKEKKSWLDWFPEHRKLVNWLTNKKDSRPKTEAEIRLQQRLEKIANKKGQLI